MEPTVHPCYEPSTGSWQYVVACPSTKEALIIDPVLDFDPVSATISTASADALLALVAQQGYAVRYLLETHAHADHLTAAFYLQQQLLASGQSRPAIGIGQRIRLVQNTFAAQYHVPVEELAAAFDTLLADGAQLAVGALAVAVLALPGHTPDHVGYRIGANVFTGDSLFNPDVGSARCDFPGGDARALYRSMQTLLALPPDCRLYTGHDYPPADGDGQRDPLPYVTVAEQRERNKHAKEGSSEEAFVRWRSERDQGLRQPRLMHQAMRVNIRGGRLPGVFMPS